MAELQGVADTTFIPMAARIYVSKTYPEYFCDEVALALEEKLPVESVLATSSEYSLVASVARYYNLDRIARAFIEEHGACNIVNLGCGMETMSHRLQTPGVTFFEIDLPDVIQTRLSVLGTDENEVVIPGDMFACEWFAQVSADKPTLFIVSGVFQYFHDEEVRAFIGKLRDAYPGAELVFDSTSSGGLEYANAYVRKTGNKNAMMYFSVDDPKAFADSLGVTLVSADPFFTDARRMLRGKAKLYTRIAMRVADSGNRSIVNRLRL